MFKRLKEVINGDLHVQGFVVDFEKGKFYITLKIYIILLMIPRNGFNVNVIGKTHQNMLQKITKKTQTECTCIN